MNTKLPRPHRVLTTSIAALILNCGTTDAALWNANADGNWSDPARWTGGVPNGPDAVADASSIDITANRTITLDGNFTVGTLRFGDAVTASNDWTLNLPAGNTTNMLTLDVGTGAPTLEVVNRNATIGVILAGTDGLTKTGAGTAFLTGTNTYTGNTTVSAGSLMLGSGGLVVSLQTTRVINSVGVATNAPGGFEIRRSDAYTVPFPISNPREIGNSHAST